METKKPYPNITVKLTCNKTNNRQLDYVFRVRLTSVLHGTALHTRVYQCMQQTLYGPNHLTLIHGTQSST